jgi:hypothetical protein
MQSADPPDQRPTGVPTTADVPLWTVIRSSTDAISFHTYEQAVADLVGTSRHGLRNATELFMAGGVAVEEDAADPSPADDPPARPQLVELIWSYWLEEGRLAETMEAISLRFQNRRRARRDPLTELKIDVLRPLGHLLWQYVQDEPHRLTARRRAYEYDHQYGLRVGGADEPLQPVESRSRFPRAFGDLLRRADEFYADDDATADASRVLQAIRKVHLVLAEGAHNQFGDLPSTARQEMLMEQFILARPEFDDYLPSSNVFPEPWMSRVDAMRRLQGWGDTSIQHYRDLATFGEQVLLSVRFGNWTEVTDPGQAANWARFWRAEVQGYIAAFRAVNGGTL